MRIIFVRHADHINDKLTRLGKVQAKTVCNDLKSENISRVYVSPSGRTIETAQIITAHLKLEDAIICDELREREGLVRPPKNQQEIEFYNNYLNPNFSMVSPEGCKNFLERCFAFLNRIISENKNAESILIVGHSSFVYALNAFFCGIPQNTDLIWIRIGNCSKICYETK